ncbi:type II secretion system protein [Mucisphaera calidilacus]|uniref:Type II secretion system protein G n=1 Tax=Mucisphaera calidilacus TaxID=2527982 RepID=A0A518BXH7_9BACT|nr:type II secretion system protein [Mucisphaera calidilacus]QDU71658.1 hypothetical protein Pan265_15100 [Mucisphaera calidilacus]
MTANIITTRHARGFTLIEILVVISIIAVLISLILAGVTAITGNSKEILTTANFTTLEAAVDSYKELTGRWPRVPFNPSTGQPLTSPIYTDNGRDTAWSNDFFDELQKFGDISSAIGPLLSSPPDDLGPDDIRTFSPVADGWGYGIIPIVPKDITSHGASSQYRPWFYSSGPDGGPIDADTNGGIATQIVIDINEGNVPGNEDLLDENDNRINDEAQDLGIPADDLYSASAP